MRLLEGRTRQLRGREDVADGLTGVVGVARVARLQVRERPDQLVPHRERIARAVIVNRQDLVGHTVPGEVLHIHGHGLCLAGTQAGVQPQVADDEVDPAVAGEIAGHDPVPPALALFEARCLHADELPAACIVKHGDRHPFTDNDQIEPPVAVHVAPYGIGDHPHVLELGGEPFGHVAEMAVPVVLQQHAAGIGAVTPRHHAPADEEIDVPISVVVGRRHARAAHVFARQAPRRLPELAPPVVQIQSVLKRRRHRREFAAAADDV